MPISSDPSDSFPAKLTGDTASTFHLRFVTARQARRIARLVTEAVDCQDDDKAIDLLDEAIGVGLVRHEGVTVHGTAPAADAKPSEYLSINELFELATLAHRGQAEEELRRKKQFASAPAIA